MKNVLSVNEAIEALGISRTTLYRMIGDGTLSAYKLGTKTILKSDEVQQFVDGLPKAEIASDFSRG